MAKDKQINQINKSFGFSLPDSLEDLVHKDLQGFGNKWKLRFKRKKR